MLLLSKHMDEPTICKQWLRQFSEERFKQAADYVQVLPSLWNDKGQGLLEIWHIFYLKNTHIYPVLQND